MIAWLIMDISFSFSFSFFDKRVALHFFIVVSSFLYRRASCLSFSRFFRCEFRSLRMADTSLSFSSVFSNSLTDLCFRVS